MVAKTRDSEVQERAQSRDGAKAQEELSASRAAGNTTRTSASAGRSCRMCDAPITGRRRNGFCSDRCRLRASRAEKRKRLERALANLERRMEGFVVEMQSELESLRADLLGENGRGEGRRRSG